MNSPEVEEGGVPAEGDEGGTVPGRDRGFSALFDSLPIGLYRTTPEGKVVYANPAMVDMLGCPDLEALKARNAGTFYVDDEERREWKRIMAETGIVRNFKARMNRLDGGTIWTVENSRAIRTADGELEYYEGSIQDVTDSTMMEKALMDSEEMFRLLSEQSLLGIAILQNGTFRYFNRTAANIFGDSIENMLRWGPTDYVDYIHPDDREFVMEQARRKQEGDGDVIDNYQIRIIARGGETKWIDIYSRTIEFGGGPADLITFIDITGRRWAEDALSTAVKQWVSTFDSMSDAVSLLDGDGVIIQCNRATAQLIGRPFTEIIGSNCVDVMGGTEDADGGCPMADAVRTLGRASSVIRRDDRWLQVTIDPILDEDGEMTGAVHIVSDVTDRQEAEARIRASLEEKEVLLKEIHHRVKNNLQVISSMLSLQGDLRGETSLEELNRDSQNRIRSMALVHEKLYRSGDLARIDIGDYIDTLVSGLKRSYLRDGDGITIDVDVDDIHLSIDRAIPCGLMINELVSNSLKHAFPEGEGSITIGFGESGSGTMVLSVRDDGVGIPDDVDLLDMESMGMVLVRTLVEQLEGDVEVASGAGLEYRIEFEDDGMEAS